MEYLIYYLYPMPVVVVFMFWVMLSAGKPAAKFNNMWERAMFEGAIAVLYTIVWPMLIYYFVTRCFKQRRTQ